MELAATGNPTSNSVGTAENQVLLLNKRKDSTVPLIKIFKILDSIGWEVGPEQEGLPITAPYWMPGVFTDFGTPYAESEFQFVILAINRGNDVDLLIVSNPVKSTFGILTELPMSFFQLHFQFLFKGNQPCFPLLVGIHVG